MPQKDFYDAIVIGAGPNGLAAAITLSTSSMSVLLVEAGESIGGGLRSAELTLPSFIHDICASVHPLAMASPFFRSLDLQRYGVTWIHPEIPLAHPFEDGSALYLHRSLEITSDGLGSDGKAYRHLLAPFIEHYEGLLSDILAPLHIPAHPWLMTRFALRALPSARYLAFAKFQRKQTRALFAGIAAHAMISLDKPATAAFGIVLATLAHVVGWPIIKGGSQKLADALANAFTDRGGEIVTGKPITSIKELPQATWYFFNITPRQLLHMNGLELSPEYRRKLSQYRYGPGVCKVDWALTEPIPWKAPICRQAGTVHLGNSFEEIDLSLRAVNSGRIHTPPSVVLTQPSLFDPSRAPKNRHTAWAYCHVPHRSGEDVADLVENTIEHYAPGFREIILARSTMTAVDMERHNPNYVGGDINGGLQDVRQLYARPVCSFSPYRTSQKNVFLCSSSTPPGGGVHGMCGYHAAKNIVKG